MCLQCLTKSDNYGACLPGIYLMKSTVDHPEWPLGYWGLVICNDPFAVFAPLVEDPNPTNDPEIDSRIDNDTYESYFKSMDGLETVLILDLYSSYNLLTAMRNAGLEIESSELTIITILHDHLINYIKTATTSSKGGTSNEVGN